MLQLGLALARPSVPTDTTRFRLTRALRMVTMGRSGSQAGYLSEQGHGITGLNTSTGTSITIATIAGDIGGHSPPEANVLPNRVSRFVVERCMTLVATKPPEIVDRFGVAGTGFETDFTKIACLLGYSPLTRMARGTLRANPTSQKMCLD
jgi:hypothetical protein